MEDGWTLLGQAGYRRISPPPGASTERLRIFRRLSKDSTFYHDGRGIEVELHWRSSAVQRGAGSGASSLIKLPGVGLVPALRAEALFIYLCVHGSGHAWMRLKWLADIAMMLRDAPNAVDLFWAAAVEAGEEVAVETALRLSSRLLGSDLPAALKQRTELRVRLLIALSLQAMNVRGGWSEPSQTFTGRFAEPAAALILAKDLRAALHCLHVMLVPVEDVMRVRLPRVLAFLYPALRVPLWIWKNGLGGRRG